MGKSGKIGYWLIYGLTRPLAVLPLGFHRAMGRAIGWTADKVFRYRHDVVMANLSRSFPDKKYKELKQISHKFYAHLGTIACEMIWFGGCSPERLKRSRIVEISNPGVINSIHDSGRSVLVMLSHSGNWELLGGSDFYSPDEPLKYTEKDLCIVFKKLSNPAWDRFIRWNRLKVIQDRKNCEGLVETHSVIKYMLSHRAESKMYDFITDQHPYKGTPRVDVDDFLHQKTVSMNGAAVMANRFGMAVAYMGMKIKEDGNYVVSYDLISEDASKDDPVDILNRYYSFLQRDIEAQPWNWLWTHKRWK